MKHRVTKICSLLPFALMLLTVVLFPIWLFVDFAFLAWVAALLMYLGWLPSFISSVLGIVFSWLSPKEKNAEDFFVISIVACFLSFCWGLFIIKTFWNWLQDWFLGELFLFKGIFYNRVKPDYKMNWTLGLGRGSDCTRLSSLGICKTEALLLKIYGF